jgi:hypothetical protein
MSSWNLERGPQVDRWTSRTTGGQGGRAGPEVDCTTGTAGPPCPPTKFQLYTNVHLAQLDKLKIVKYANLSLKIISSFNVNHSVTKVNSMG